MECTLGKKGVILRHIHGKGNGRDRDRLPSLLPLPGRPERNTKRPRRGPPHTPGHSANSHRRRDGSHSSSWRHQKALWLSQHTWPTGCCTPCRRNCVKRDRKETRHNGRPGTNGAWRRTRGANPSMNLPQARDRKAETEGPAKRTESPGVAAGAFSFHGGQHLPGKGADVDALAVQLLDGPETLGEVPGQAVDPRDHHGVAGSELSPELLPGGPAHVPARSHVGEDAVLGGQPALAPAWETRM